MKDSKEWLEAFNLHYNNSDLSAPYLNEYEISVFLTQAQDEIVKQTFTGKNNFLEGFESTEYNRRALNNLIKHKELNLLNTEAIDSNYNKYTYSLDDNCWSILEEKVVLDNNAKPLVIPIKLDELNIKLRNPFTVPNNRKIYRLDTINDSSNIYLISNNPINKYTITYLEEPEPIILVDLDTGEYENMGLSIKGETKTKLCKLNSLIHINILNRAVELALRDYNPSNLEAHVQLNQRNI